MKIFTKDIEDIENEINDLSKILYNSNNLSELNYYRFLGLIIAYSSIFKKVTKKNPMFLQKNPELILEEMELSNKFYKKNIASVMENKSLHFDTLLAASSFVVHSNKIEKSIFDFTSSTASSYSEEMMYEIITDYLKKYHNENKDLIKKLVAKNSIYLLDIFDDEYGGYTLTNEFSKKHKIVIDPSLNGIEKMQSLVHEIGHVVDNNDAIEKNIISKYNIQSNYNEVISSFYEKEFLEFLIEENIDSDLAKKNLAIYYIQVYDLFQKLYVASKLSDDFIKTDSYMNMSKKQIIENTLYDPLTKNCNFESGRELDIYTNASYGYGKLLGAYFSHLKSCNKDKYNIAFNKFLDIRHQYFNSNIFENIDTTRYEIFTILGKEKDKVLTKK